MRLVVAAVGRLKQGPERDLVQRYHSRAVAAGRSLGFRSVDVIEVDESRARQAPERVTAEGRLIEAAIPEGAEVIALDARGKSIGSEEFAGRLVRWRDTGLAAAFFAIGGADGLAEPILARASLRLAFGAQTWPHQLVRIMLFEQIYRAVTLLSGHPYHRA